MSGFLGGAYLWVKALHIIAIIAWMAGMLYLPRLFVYHAEAAPGSAQSETFKVMERRLQRAIVNPAMVAAWIFGLMLATHLDLWSASWFHAKLALAFFGMGGLHGFLSRWRRQFAADGNRHTARFYRIVNEAVTLVMVAIVILVVVRPF